MKVARRVVRLDVAKVAVDVLPLFGPLLALVHGLPLLNAPENRHVFVHNLDILTAARLAVQAVVLDGMPGVQAFRGEVTVDHRPLIGVEPHAWTELHRAVVRALLLHDGVHFAHEQVVLPLNLPVPLGVQLLALEVQLQVAVANGRGVVHGKLRIGMVGGFHVEEFFLVNLLPSTDITVVAQPVVLLECVHFAAACFFVGYVRVETI